METTKKNELQTSTSLSWLRECERSQDNKFLIAETWTKPKHKKFYRENSPGFADNKFERDPCRRNFPAVG